MIHEQYIVKSRETALAVVQTRIDSLRKKEITQTGWRVYDGGYLGVAGTLGEVDREELRKQAINALELKIPYPGEPSAGNRVELNLTPEIIPETRYLEEMEALLTVLGQNQPAFSFSGQIKLVEEEVRLQNDRKLDLASHQRYLQMDLIFKEKTSANILDGGAWFVGRTYDRERLLELNDRICEAYLRPAPLPTVGNYPVIFLSNELLPLKKFNTDLNGEKFGAKSSLLMDKQGQQTFNRNFTLVQSANPDDGIATFFDAEGTVNPDYRYPLIKDGVVMGPYTDKKTALTYGLPLTGSAVAGYDDVPSLGYRGFFIGDTGQTIKQLLGGRPGILALIAGGGDFTPAGDFATPVQLAYLFDGETLIGRLPQLQISSNLFTMFGPAFIGVSTDKFFSLGFDRYLVMEMEVSKL